MEHFVINHIDKSLSADSIRLDSKHGFREKLLSMTQLISYCYDWATTVQSGSQVDVVFLDFSNEFD